MKSYIICGSEQYESIVALIKGFNSKKKANEYLENLYLKENYNEGYSNYEIIEVEIDTTKTTGVDKLRR